MAGTLITDRRTATATYKILRRLGKGGMAEVFLAHQEGIAGVRRMAVVKKILPQFSEVETVAEMLLDEARIAIQLSHPNIVQIYELGKDGEQYFIAMEYVDGCDLATLARVERHRQSRIPMRLTLRVVSEAAMGLDFAHRQKGLDGRPLNVVHRDVSPHNIMCSREGAVKVTDFGIAKAVGKVQVTEVGVVKGKVQYMSPEQYTGAEVDHRADIFSLGVVLYQLTTGRLPRATKNGNLSMKRVIEGRIPRPSEIRPDYPEPLEEVVMRALSQSPGDRYPDAASLRDDLLDFARQHDLLAFPKELGDYVNELVPPTTAAHDEMGERIVHGGDDELLVRKRSRLKRASDSEVEAAEHDTASLGTEKVSGAGRRMPAKRVSYSEVASEAIIESATLDSRAVLSNEELTPPPRSEAAAEIASQLEALELGADPGTADPDTEARYRANLKGVGVAGLAERAREAREQSEGLELPDEGESPDEGEIPDEDGVSAPDHESPLVLDGLDDPTNAPTHVARKNTPPDSASVQVDDSIVIEEQPPEVERDHFEPPAMGQPDSEDWDWGHRKRGTERAIVTERTVVPPTESPQSNNNAMVLVLGLAVVLGIGGLIFLAANRQPPPGPMPKLAPKPVVVSSGTIDVMANPAKARVMIDGSQRCASTPCRIEALPLGTLLVTVKAAGYRLWNQRVVLSEAKSRLVLSPILEPVSGSSRTRQPEKTGPAKTSSAGRAGRSVRTASARTAGKTGGKKGTGKVTRSKIDAKVALISVDVRPAWAEVWVDGKRVGPTPLQRAIPPGRHTIELKNEKYKFHRKYKLTFKIGENVKIKDRITPPAKQP